MMATLSPCESCLTLATPVQYNSQVFTNYLNTRLTKTRTVQHLESNDEELELIMIYNHHDINVKLTAVHNLITTYCQIDIADLTLSHLFIYFYATQSTLGFYPQEFLINQINLIHLGKSYTFGLNANQPKLKELNVHTYNKFLIVIKPDTQGGCYKEFKIEKYLNQEKFVDQSTGSVTFADSIASKLKQVGSNHKTISKSSRHSKRIILRRILHNLHRGYSDVAHM
ncbi:uncharacterized protein SPAPADRAFT_57682 [Spathaspora passalidarum NRRL Y-27907]|uniref:Uncharacterized protein n=1 Tax=Spathaspora passalidarum (strain NRRL Y-27907 / 11-Y1) TaxID=619300 RepID=G3AGV8_SPAPN|nr:uncharacterized protein SPAPADRAFT_57682 [Spathaspora passalidarum NRRL Y-27907]EGW34631.1 hypothetical protein SPAPADRAFT_57682 [Spathaspora passalidarum NRRL Y-27907]